MSSTPLRATLALSVDHLAEYVRGFPMHFALTATLIHDPGFASRFPAVSLERALDVTLVFTPRRGGRACTLGGPFSGKMRSAVGEEAGDFGADFVDLVVGEPTRLLFDAGSLGVEAPDPGVYSVEVTYHGVTALPFEVTVRAPTGLEHRELSAAAGVHAPSSGKGVSWSDWVMTGLAPKTPPHISGTDPLRYLRVLRFLYTSPTNLEDVNPAFLDTLDGFYAPEAELLRAELARSRNDSSEFERRAGAIRTTYPALISQLRLLEAGESPVAQQRELARSLADWTK